MPEATSIQELKAQLSELGVEPGCVLLVHTSFRKVRPVSGGPAALIEALSETIGPRGTLVMPSMTAGDSPFDPASTPTLDMGVTAETFWRGPGVIRSTHPGASFAARGPQAESICRPQPLSPPHGEDSPVGRVHELDGWVLLLGVDHSESTTLHLAESLAQVPYSVEHPCIVGSGDDAHEAWIAETDHCCEGFKQLNSWLDAAGLQRMGQVGYASARLSRARDVVATALRHLAVDPLIFLCQHGAECSECDAARASVAQLP
ncbi:MAG: AAC(3) family N-acetyltransferase [Polyangiaceae bacterium]|nr:AAC(3) family N-acetyltransferase [Myxococcales bacterium]MCB9590756.1 AAC(3) family N-acetyltransferase [Polyangiaceae bacterium]